MKWTSEQQKVIKLRDRNILVSAAAGSGKTAVLVERIIQKVLDEDNPIDIDRMLITTFTNAAAAEMRERIGLVLSDKLDQEPDNEHLKKQLTLLHNAKITTIHGFCLFLLRNHFHTIQLDPGFRLGDEGELKLLKQDTASKILEECYEEGGEDFFHFVECYAGGKTDKALESFILQVYEYSRSYPWPEKWLESCKRINNIEKKEDIEQAEWMQKILDNLKILSGDLLRLNKKALEIALEPGGPYMQEPVLSADREVLERLTQIEHYEDAFELLSELKWKVLSRKKDTEVSPEKREQVKGLRDGIKDEIKKLKESFFTQSLESIAEDMKRSFPALATLIDLALLFTRRYRQAKEEKNIIDFNDLEHFALEILLEEGADEHEVRRTETGKEYSRFFHEIFIDEYQDINLIQELILKSVSKEETEGNNQFMVGDVKQSIYKFRLSRPDLFIQKYNKYTDEDSLNQRIDLHKNFRSRSQVLSFVNYVFYQIMKPSLGNIKYDEKAALYPGADFPEDISGEKQTELILMDFDKDALREYDGDWTERELEARAAAGKIKRMVDHYPVLDKVTGDYRKAKYSDIVILLRSLSGWAEVFQTVLSEEGIPAHTPSRTGYFSAVEVQVVLNYLRVVDNPNQDIPLTSVLHSPIADFTNYELSIIRSEFPDRPFYKAVQGYRENGKNTDLKIKLSKFFLVLNKFRDQVVYTPINELIENIYEDTGYADFVKAMPAGAVRRGNLDMLLEKARSFASSSYKGVFNFIRYMEQLQKYEVDFGEAGTDDENDNTVRIMSIHKSKGLEFPVVILAGLGKGFNTQDSRSKIVIHQDLKVGTDFIDPELRIKSPTLLKKLIQREIFLENLGEELRVLYVALTRAKEKLILMGSMGQAEKKLKKLSEQLSSEAGSFRVISGAKSYMDWILGAVYMHPDFKGIFEKYELPYPCVSTSTLEKTEFTAAVVTIEDLVVDEVKERVEKDVEKERFGDFIRQAEVSEEALERLDQKLNYSYPHKAETETRTKITVSELKKMGQYEEEEADEVLYKEPEVIPLLPEFLSGEEKATGAARGTAYHTVIENIKLGKESDFAFVKKTIEKLTEENKLTEEMARFINKKYIAGFLKSEIAARMAKAEEAGQLYKEQPFVIGRKASQISGEYHSDEIVLVQGIIDAYFLEEDELVIVDYKSDFVQSGEELTARYKVQLDSYAEALEQMTGKKVKEKIIYALALSEEISIEAET